MSDRFTPDRFAPTVGAAVDELTGYRPRRPRGHEVGRGAPDDTAGGTVPRTPRPLSRAQRAGAGVALGERGQARVVGLELGIAGPIGVAVAAALLAVVASGSTGSRR